MRTYGNVTICFSLPRSRSQWMAWAMQHHVQSWHDPLKLCESPYDLKVRIDAERPEERIFIADTSAVMFHDSLRELLPGAKFLFVLRPAMECYSSAIKQGHSAQGRLMDQLCLLSERLGVLSRRGPEEDRCTYANVELFLLAHWRGITGGPVPDFRQYLQMCRQYIDRPLRLQPVNPEKTQRLMAHRDKFVGGLDPL